MVLSGVEEEVVLLHRREATEGGGHDQLTAPLRAEQFRGPRRDRRLEPLGDIGAVRARAARSPRRRLEQAHRAIGHVERHGEGIGDQREHRATAGVVRHPLVAVDEAGAVRVERSGAAVQAVVPTLSLSRTGGVGLRPVRRDEVVHHLGRVHERSLRTRGDGAHCVSLLPVNRSLQSGIGWLRRRMRLGRAARPASAVRDNRRQAGKAWAASY